MLNRRVPDRAGVEPGHSLLEAVTAGQGCLGAMAMGSTWKIPVETFLGIHSDPIRDIFLYTLDLSGKILLYGHPFRGKWRSSAYNIGLGMRNFRPPC
jgi:hypothetical protein